MKTTIGKKNIIPVDSSTNNATRENSSLRPGLRNRNMVDYAALANPKIKRLIQMPKKPHIPEHVGGGHLKVLLEHIGLNVCLIVLIKCITLVLSAAHSNELKFQNKRKSYLQYYHLK